MKLRYLLFLLVVLPVQADVTKALANATVLRDVALAIVDSTQGVIDSLQAVAMVDTIAAEVDTVYPGLVAAGLVISPYPADPLYVLVTVPFDVSTATERLSWREGKISLSEGVGTSCLIEKGPWSWAVHRNELIKVLGYFNTVMVSSEGGPSMALPAGRRR